MTARFELIKKLSVKTVCGKPKAPQGKETVWKMEVFGVATGIKRGETAMGPWYAFTGTFQAVNMDNGKIYRSGILFLPEVAGGLMLPQINDQNRAVEFGFRIGVKADDESAVGYIYVAEPLMPVSENDPIELLSRKMQALPAPAKEQEKSHAKVIAK